MSHATNTESTRRPVESYTVVVGGAKLMLRWLETKSPAAAVGKQGGSVRCNVIRETIKKRSRAGRAGLTVQVGKMSR